MADRSEREIRSELEELRGEDDGSSEFEVDPEDLSAEFREADPAERPDGIEWDAETGTLYYDVWSAQRDALDELENDDEEKAADIVAFLAGYGSGKSVAGARWLIANALEYPGGHFLAMGQSFSEARTSTFDTLFTQLPGERTARVTSGHNGPEQSPLVDDYNRAEHRITLVNDSVVTLGSADKWSRFAGAEFSAVWLDEPSHYGSDLHDLVEMIGGRLRGVEGPKKQFWTLTGNGYNEAYEILEQRQDSTGEPIGLRIELIRASTLENPYIDEADKDRFKRQYAGTAREEQALMGGFAAAQGLVYSDFTRNTHVRPHAEIAGRVEDGWRVYGYDAGWNDPRVLLEIGRTPYGQLVVLDEFYQSNTHVADVIAWLERNGKPQEKIYCEHEPSDIEKFRQAGWPAEQATKSIDAGISEVKRRLQPDGVGGIDDAAGTGGSVGPKIRRPASMPSSGSNSSSRSGSWGSPRPQRMNTPGTVEYDDEEDDDDGDKPFATITGSSDSEDDDEQQENDAGCYGLLVSSNCEHLIQEFLSYKEEHVGSNRAVDHGLDALRYACMGAGGGSSGGARPRMYDIDPW